jgi:hypothetical protein
MWYGRLADATAIVHGLITLYIIVGFVVILVGLWRRWPIARRFWFRFSHLVLCLGVAAFEVVNSPCPLTALEQWLREQQAQGGAYEGSFIAHYVHQAIHLPVPPWVLAGPMLAFCALVAVLYLWRGPERTRDQPDSKP